MSSDSESVDPIVPTSYEPGEQVWVAAKFGFLGYRRAQGRVLEKIDDFHYKVMFLIQIVMQEPCTHDFHTDLIAKFDDPDKWPPA